MIDTPTVGTSMIGIPTVGTPMIRTSMIGTPTVGTPMIDTPTVEAPTTGTECSRRRTDLLPERDVHLSPDPSL